MTTLPPPPALKPIAIGPVTVAEPVVLAPMTGVTDMPFRTLVRRYGSGLNVTEMVASEAAIRETRVSTQKTAWDRIEEPVSMQLVGCDPASMAEAAKIQEGNGAAIIDINFGCPVKKVALGQSAGSALMRDEIAAGRILEAMVKAVRVPVTLKMRMGATHFLCKTLPKVATEMALCVLGYNLTRVLNIVGVKALVAAIRA